MMRLIAFILDLLLGWLFEDEMPCETVEVPVTEPVQFKQTVFEFEPMFDVLATKTVEQLDEQPIVSWREFKKYNQLVNSYLTKGDHSYEKERFNSSPKIAN